jgi:hypothetical protein
MRYRVGLGLPRMKGSGGYKRPRLKTTCGDNGGKNRLGLPCRCKELFKRGKPIERGAAVDKGARCKYHGGMLAGPKTPEGWARAIKAGIEALTRYRAQRNGRIGSRTREGATT